MLLLKHVGFVRHQHLRLLSIPLAPAELLGESPSAAPPPIEWHADVSAVLSGTGGGEKSHHASIASLVHAVLPVPVYEHRSLP